MAEITVALPIGFKVGEQIHTEAVLRELTTADLIEAGQAAEKVVRGDDGAYHLVQSPTLAGVEMLCRQVVRIGDIKGPLTPPELFKLEGADFLALQAGAEQLDQAVADAMRRAAERGRSDPAP